VCYSLNFDAEAKASFDNDQRESIELFIKAAKASEF
jgi:hypothetical protein